VSASAFEDLPYRPGVGIMLLDRKARVFVARRIDMPSQAWQMPQGGIDDGELPEQAVMRELEEETGTDKVEIIAESDGWYSYDLPDWLIPKVWGGKFRGQRQKWYALRFLGRDEDINIETENPEFLDWKWVQMGELPDLIVPFKRSLYLSLVEEFADLGSVGKEGTDDPPA